MAKREKREPTRRMQVRIGSDVAREVEAMARRMGVSDSALMAMLVSVGLPMMRAHLDVKDELVSAYANGERVRQAQGAEGQHQGDLDDRLGFQPPARPRGFHELADELPEHVPGSDWSGYMRGL